MMKYETYKVIGFYRAINRQHEGIIFIKDKKKYISNGVFMWRLEDKEDKIERVKKIDRKKFFKFWDRNYPNRLDFEEVRSK